MVASDLRVSLVQGDTVWHDPAANRAMYGEMMAPLRGQTDLIVLPETFTSGFSNEAIDRAEGMDGPTVAWIVEQAATLGAVVGLSLQGYAFQHVDTGIVSTLSTTYPIWVIPVAAFFLKEYPTPMQVFCTILAIVGIALLMLPPSFWIGWLP